MQQQKNTWYKFRLKGLVEQHNPDRIAKNIKGVFPFKEVRYGNLKKGDGDIVIINLLDNNEFVSFREFMDYFYFIDRVEKIGIYTNIYFSKKFFQTVISLIND